MCCSAPDHIASELAERESTPPNATSTRQVPACWRDYARVTDTTILAFACLSFRHHSLVQMASAAVTRVMGQEQRKLHPFFEKGKTFVFPSIGIN